MRREASDDEIERWRLYGTADRSWDDRHERLASRITAQAAEIEALASDRDAAHAAVAVVREALSGAMAYLFGRTDSIAGEVWNDCNKAVLGLPAAVTKRLEEWEAVGNLLARIHGDGGQYQQQHGTAKAAADAEAKFNKIRQHLAEDFDCPTCAGIGTKDYRDIGFRTFECPGCEGERSALAWLERQSE